MLPTLKHGPLRGCRHYLSIMRREENYAEFFVRERGVATSRHLNVELETSYSPAFNDALKALLSHGVDRIWDADLKRWFIAAEVMQRTIELAKQYYRSVYLTEGETTTELISGRVYNAPKLF